MIRRVLFCRVRQERFQTIGVRLPDSCQGQKLDHFKDQYLNLKNSSDVMKQSHYVMNETCAYSEKSLSSKGIMGDMNNILPKSEKSPSEKEALLNFEESQIDLEASISKAVQLVSQKLSPGELISRYEVGSFSEQAGWSISFCVIWHLKS